jgi:hypothetical protein
MHKSIKEMNLQRMCNRVCVSILEITCREEAICKKGLVDVLVEEL